MPTHAAENGRAGVGAAAREVAEHASTLARLELELATLEMRRKAGALGSGVVLAGAGVLVALYGVGFLLATGAAALATFLPMWLALLIVSLVLLGVAGALAAVGVSRIRRGTPPVPEQAIAEARRTTEAVRS
jgi:Putative Actinobacterial Holin-X, holin superfamily III